LITFRILTIGVLCFSVLPMGQEVLAQEETGEVTEESIRRDGLQGVIVDDTATFIGRQFYDAFAVAWLDQGAGEQNLSVHEQPTAHSGSRIWIEHNRRTLFQVFLSPIRADIEATADRAAASVAQRFKALELERTLFKNPDLAPDEF
jgi:curli production assembly/transport component CsgE